MSDAGGGGWGLIYVPPGQIKHQEKSSVTGNYLMPTEDTLWSNFACPKGQEIKIKLYTTE